MKATTPFRYLLILTTVFVLLVDYSFSSEKQYHVVQIGSYPNLKAAQDTFDHARKSLQSDQQANLRIEEIGKFHVVRIGKFDDYSSVSQFYPLINKIFSDSFIMSAYYRPDRIKKSNIANIKNGVENFSNNQQDTSSPATEKEPSIQNIVQSDDSQNTEFYTLQLTSLPTEPLAQNAYNTYSQKLASTSIHYLRIEKIGGHFTIRLGKFNSYNEAKNLQNKIADQSMQSLLMSAFIRPSRIINLADETIPYIGHRDDDSPLHPKDEKDDVNVTLEKTPLLTDAAIVEEPLDERSPGIQSMDTENIVDSTNSVFNNDSEIHAVETSQIEPTADKSSLNEIAASKPGGEDFVQETGSISVSDSEEIGDASIATKKTTNATDKNAEIITGSDSEADRGEETVFAYETIMILNKDDQGEPIRYPGNIFYDTNQHEIYLVNGGSRRIILYGSDYFPQYSIGSGRKIESAISGVVDSDGLLYISQAATNEKPPRMTILNGAFYLEKEFTFSEAPNTEKFIPQRVAIGKDKTIYTVGLNVPDVLMFDNNGKYKGSIAVKDSKYKPYGDESKKENPTVPIKSIKTDSNGNIYLLSEETSRIYVYNADHEFLFSFGKKGGSKGKMSRPRDIAIDENKRCIYVVDYMRHTVLIFDFEGNFRYEFGGQGWSPGWFNFPISLEIGRNSSLLVADLFNNRIQVMKITLPEEFPERSEEKWLSQL